MRQWALRPQLRRDPLGGTRPPEHLLQARTGEYVYVPADMPHLVMNRLGTHCRVLVAHSAADDQVGIVLLPELDALV